MVAPRGTERGAALDGPVGAEPVPPSPRAGPRLPPAGLPRPVAARARLLTVVAICALALLNGADVVTTQALQAHRGVEVNPLSALLLASQSLLWVKMGILGVFAWKVLRRPPKLGVVAAVCFAAGIYATAVMSNLLVLRMAAR